MRGPEFGDNLDNLNPFDEGIEKEPRRHYLFTNNDISDHPVIFDCYAETDEEAEAEYKQKMGKDRDGGYIGISVVLE